MSLPKKTVKVDNKKNLERQTKKTVETGNKKVVEAGNKKILVTGGLGFIGRTLIETLLRQNYEAKIYIVDIKPFPNDSLILNNSNVSYKNIDITEKETIQQYIANIKPDIVIHLAAVSRVEDAERDKQKCIKTNYVATKYIVEEVAKHQKMTLIFASSREVYGESENLPVKETDELLPYNIYGCYKLRAEEYIRRHLQKYIILRFSNVYGNTYDRCERVIPKFVKAAMSGGTITLEGGEQIIDFTYIDDTVQAIIKSMECLFTGKISKDTIHILPGKDNKITCIIDILEKLGYKFQVETNDPRNYDVQQFYGDPTHMQASLGLDPEKFTSLENGIKQYIEAIKLDTLKNTKQEIIHFGKLIYEKGYNVSIDGNISVRLSDKEILITATGTQLGFLTEDDLVIIDYDGNLLQGSRRASSEKITHLGIYKERPDVNAVIHVHAPNCLALSLLDVDIEHNLYITIAPIPITKFAVPSTQESYEQLKPFIKDYNWGILRRHGAITWEKDLLAAFLRLEGMEHLAKVMMLALPVKNNLEPIQDDDKQRLLKSWGIL